jgi:hypothetical protein
VHRQASAIRDGSLLKSIIESEIIATQTHLEQAKNICKQWDAKTAKSGDKKNY